MKKLALFTLALTLGVMTAHSQGSFQAGGHLGLPVGDAGDFTTFAIAVDLAYILEVDEGIGVGPALGYSHSFGEEISPGLSIDDIQFLPVAGRAIFDLGEQFLARAEVGYAIGINDGNDGGFYYSPQIGFSVSDAIDLILAYRGITRDGGSFDMVTFGASFNIN